MLKIWDYTIYNIIVQRILQGKLQESAILNVESLAKGMYFLKTVEKTINHP